MANGSDHPGSNTVLVLGSNGKTGSRIVERLRVPLADGVQRALGRGPKKFSDYVERTAAAGAWDAKSP